LKSNQRFAVAVVILLAATIFLHATGHYEALPPRLPLPSFPSHLLNWEGQDQAIPADSLAVLGPGDFLLREYQETSSVKPGVALFLAFFPSQRSGDAIHSPKNCLPGSGWYPLEASRINLSLPGHAPFPVNRYLIAKGTDRQLVLYWYWAHDRGVASEYWAKFYLVADSVRLHRSDGALVRVTTPLAQDEKPDEAQARLLSFTAGFFPLLDQYIPR